MPEKKSSKKKAAAKVASRSTSKAATKPTTEKVVLTVQAWGGSTKKVKVEPSKSLKDIVEFLRPDLAGKNYVTIAKGSVVKATVKALSLSGEKIVVVPPIKGSL